MRLEWVRFLARVNEQSFKESSWRDISVCGAHFERRCFERPGHPPAKLKPGAVPSLPFQSHEPEPRHGETHEVRFCFFPTTVVLMCTLQVIMCACKIV